MTSRRRDNPEEDQPGVAAQTACEDDVAPKSPSAPLGGARLGHFRLIAELGRGGMGIVYRAEDEALRRSVAIKVLPSSTAGDEDRRRRFLREARAAAAVSHPNIAIVHEVGEAFGQAYIAMELVEGQSLGELLAERRLSVEEALDFARQILRGLARAHEVGIIHRDLKPDNVMITPEGVAKVLDFGLAKPDELPSTGSKLGVAETITKVTEQGLVLGTPSYMSPEQARGGAVDRRSDLFSFGVVLYEMLAGKRPYGGSTNADILTAILRDPPPPLLTSNPEVSPALADVVECCLAKEPEARYADCKSLMDALERASTAPSVDLPRRTSVPWKLTLSALGIIGLLSFGASLWRSASKGSLPAAPLSSAAPAAGPIAVTDLPSPVSTSQAAITAYRRGLEKLRLGADSASEFRRAVELDPSLAAAHLQLAAYGFINASEREHFHRAEELRSNLNPRDQALLDAIEPIVRRQPSDWGEATRRLTRALEHFPHDAQLWYELALCRVIAGTERAVPAADRALAEDPSYVSALSVKGWDLAYNGEFAEAKGALEAAFRMAPTCWSCADNLGDFLMHEGACEDTERLARQVIATGSNLATGYEQLAASLAAQGKPVATVREAMKRAWPAVEERDRKLVERRDEIVTALFSGDFEVAEGSARALMQEVEPLQRQYEHGSAARWLVQILAETGRTAEAGRAAMDFLDRQDAWEPDPRAEDFAVGHDFTPLFLAAAQRAGLLRREELTRRRAAWMTAWERKIAPAYRNYLWLQGYASIVETEADAKDAIEALPKYTPIPPFRPFTLSWMGVGPAYLLTGRIEEAVSWLSKVTRVCNGLYFPIEHTRAHAWLGQALEQKGEKAGACAAYQVVLSRWGETKQRSTTAEKVRARAKALGCGR